ncbi:MAG TPA: hypothetical protein VJT71_15540 [Pyrinomonadaceae bacterium]|nr:hypothetical protein [Pyrinomonadaceae bacterium]
MAPNTAVVFVLLGTALIIPGKRSLSWPWLSRAAILVAAVFIVARMGEYLTSLELRVDHWLFQFPSETLGLAPVGKMAFLTALTFLLLSGSMLLLTWPKRWFSRLGHALSIVVTFIGLIFCLGYLYGAPLMYSGRSIPMALNTALCFLIAGSGLVIKGSCRNAEERQAAREALQRAHAELEDRVRARTAELEQQQQYLRAIVETSPNQYSSRMLRDNLR